LFQIQTFQLKLYDLDHDLIFFFELLLRSFGIFGNGHCGLWVLKGKPIVVPYEHWIWFLVFDLVFVVIWKSLGKSIVVPSIGQHIYSRLALDLVVVLIMLDLRKMREFGHS